MAGRFTMDYITDLIEKAVKLTREEIQTNQFPKRKGCTEECTIDHLIYNIADSLRSVGPDFDYSDKDNFLKACGWKVKNH